MYISVILSEGHMRVDANVSLSRDNKPGVKTEVLPFT